MTHITFYLDFISPYAYLAFEELPKQLMGISHRVEYRPILFGAVLNHHGHMGPAEISGKREWTYRQVVWQAKQMGVQLDMPLAHPFNPLSLLRLAVACQWKLQRSPAQPHQKGRCPLLLRCSLLHMMHQFLLPTKPPFAKPWPLAPLMLCE